ncbi:MAG: DUF4276 family protein [Nitrobacter sp.]|jgi:hypothetical protein
MGFAFIVDGQTEKKIIQHICPDAPIRMTNLNGKDVSVVAIAKRVSSLIKLLKDRYYPVLVLVDREGRPQTSQELEQALCTELVDQHGIKAEEVIISCPDRMIENWMLADPKFFKSSYGIDISETYEGKNGKREIKNLLSNTSVVYHELTVGVDTFIRIDPSQLCLNSPSFLRLATKAENLCKWLRLGKKPG